MRLTNILMYYIRRRHVPGKIDIGKNRVHRPVTCRQKTAAVLEMINEQKNMDILNRPYITEEEDRNHEVDMGLVAAAKEKKKVDKLEKAWLSNRPMEEGFQTLVNNRNWE